MIETCKEAGSTVFTQETAARRENGMMENLVRVSVPWTDSRSHSRIVNQLAGGNRYFVSL
jgi:hypothetical protein